MRGFYQGVTAPLCAVTPTFAVAFYTYDFTTTTMKSNNKNESDILSIWQYCLAGGLTAIPTSFFLVPSERIKCVMQVQKPGDVKYNGSFDCAKALFRTSGIRTLYRGVGITVLRDAPGNAAYFGTYEIIRTMSMHYFGYNNVDEIPKLSVFLAGGFAGVANWIVAIPFDVVKSRLQTAPEGLYSGSMEVFKEIMKEEGITAFYRGITPALLRAFPSNAAAFMGVELAHYFLKRYHLR